MLLSIHKITGYFTKNVHIFPYLHPLLFQPLFQITLCKIPENHPQNQFSKQILNSHSFSQYPTDYFWHKKNAATLKAAALSHHNIPYSSFMSTQWALPLPHPCPSFTQPRNAHKGDARFRELVILRLCHFAKTMRQKSKLAVAQTVDFWRITQNART